MKLDGATRTLFTTLSNGFVDFIFRKKELDQFIQDIQSIFLEIFELKPINPWLTLYLEIHLVFLRVQRGEKLTPKLMQLRSLARLLEDFLWVPHAIHLVHVYRMKL